MPQPTDQLPAAMTDFRSNERVFAQPQRWT
jgi:hypothetical protein